MLKLCKYIQHLIKKKGLQFCNPFFFIPILIIKFKKNKINFSNKDKCLIFEDKCTVIMAIKKYKPNNPILDEVTEAISNYVQLIDNDSSYKSLKKKVLFSDFFEDKMLLIHIIREGLPFKIFNLIKEISPFTEDDWASYLDISKKSLQRYSTDKEYLFKSIHTEKIIELAEVTNFGKQVFDTPDQFYLWLKTPSFIFNNLKPVDLLKDSYGKELVMEELNRIEHGIFA